MRIIRFLKPLAATLATALVTACLTASAELLPDPGPDESARSSRYSVAVRTRGGESLDCFVYESRNNAKFAQRKLFIAEANHWASYSADEPVMVEVEKLHGEPPKECVIRPRKLGIEAKVAGRKVSFVLREPCQVSVEIDEEDPWIEHPLLVFANPLESEPPDPDSPGVWNFAGRGLPPADRRESMTLHFPRGVHNLVRDHGIPLRLGFGLNSGDRVHLAAGAYVIGAFGSDGDSRGITIDGRGTISGLGEAWVKSKFRPENKEAGESFSYGRCAEHLAHIRGEGHKVSGVVFTDPTHFNLNIGDQSRVEWVKCFGWHYSTDGFGLGDDTVVRNCFLKVNDDSFKLYNDGIDIADCVVWQQFNGGVFQLSWGRMRVKGGLAVRDIDIIHDEHSSPANNRGIISCVKLENSVMRGLTFENIRIEGDCYRLFDLRVHRGGSIEELTVRGLHLEGRITDASYLRAQGGSFEKLVFEGCTVGGEPVRKAEDLVLKTEGEVPEIVIK